MAIVTTTFSGGAELQKLLRELPVAVEKKIIVDATNAAAEPVLHAARSKVPVDTGLLASQITLKKSRSTRNGGSYKVRVAVAAKKGDTRANYVGPVEYGHRAADGTEVKARPFLRPAFDENVDRAIGIMTEKTRVGIAAAAPPKGGSP